MGENLNQKERVNQLIEKGKKVVTVDRWIALETIAPIRGDDLYHGMDLDDALDIVEILNRPGYSLQSWE